MKFDTRFKTGQSVWVITVCTKGKLNTETATIDKIIINGDKLFYTFNDCRSLDTIFGGQSEVEERFLTLDLDGIPELYRQLILELDATQEATHNESS